MCGIAGIISPNINLVSQQALHRMAASLAHRGPDGEACWINAGGNVGFAHRRLSITDLTPAAAQPMHLAGRYTIVFNGEIYNHPELREAMIKRGYSFNSASDTEVVLAMYDVHKEDCLQYFDGMFAFSIWDEQERRLFCARDRFGEKPFFYWRDEMQPAFYFGSEIKALVAAGVETQVNHPLLLRFLAYGDTGDPLQPSATFDNRICKLPPAHCLIYSLHDARFSVKRYWQVDKHRHASLSLKDASSQFIELFERSVKLRLYSHVSMGSSLSGGLDSSSIAAVVSRLERYPAFKTFTAAFPGFDRDEACKAGGVSHACGFENYAVTPSADEMAQDLSKLAYHQEEPFSSSGVYAQYRVFQHAKANGVVVLLDGQGADEVLGGYDKYKTWRLRSIFPGQTARILRTRAIDRLARNKDIDAGYKQAWSGGAGPLKPVVCSLNDMLYHDTFQGGLEELLRYADRNSMANGREVRLPFLSHELVTFLFSLSADYKIYNGWTKWILRMCMKDCLAADTVWQKRKIGFEPPQLTWMQTRSMQTCIYEAKAGLVKEKILDRRALSKDGNAHNAYEKESAMWRYLSAYFFINGHK